MDFSYQQVEEEQAKKKRFVLIGGLLGVLGLIFVIVAATTPRAGGGPAPVPERPFLPDTFTATYDIDDLDEEDQGSDPGTEKFEYSGTVARTPGDDPEGDLHWAYTETDTFVGRDGSPVEQKIDFQLWKGDLYARPGGAGGADAPWTCQRLQTPLPKSISSALSTTKRVEDTSSVSGKFACAEGDARWTLSVAGVRYHLCTGWGDGIVKMVTDEQHFVLHVRTFTAGKVTLPEFVVPEGTPKCEDPDPASGFTLPESFSFNYAIRGVDDDGDIDRFSYRGIGQKAPGDEIAQVRFDYNETETVQPPGKDAEVHKIEFRFFEDDLYSRDPDTGAWVCSPLGVPLPVSVSVALNSVKSAADPGASHAACAAGKAYTINVAQVVYNFCTDANGAPVEVWTDNFVMSITDFVPGKQVLPPFTPPPSTPKDCPK